MLTVENFNSSDLQKINSIPKSFKITILFFLLICVPASFLCGLLGLTKKGHGYWPTTLTLLIIFTAVVVFSIIESYLSYRKDKKRQKKYVGDLTVVGKSTKRGDKIIFTDTSELKKLNLYTNTLFDKISIGDKLVIEISKSSKILFRLEKDNIDLLKSQE